MADRRSSDAATALRCIKCGGTGVNTSYHRPAATRAARAISRTSATQSQGGTVKRIGIVAAVLFVGTVWFANWLLAHYAGG